MRLLIVTLIALGSAFIFQNGSIAFAQEFVKKDLAARIAKSGIIAAGDFNLDSLPDLLVQDDGLALYIQKDGIFEPFELSTGAFKKIESLTVADIGTDGAADIFITGQIPSGCCGQAPAFGVLSNSGNLNSFSLDMSDSPAFNESHTSFADLDKDGDLDMFLSGEDIGTPRFYDNNRSKLTLKSTATVPQSVFRKGLSAWADYDNDGDNDLAIIGTRQSLAAAVEIWRNDGLFTFVRVFDGASNCGNDCRRIEWGDIDGDGDLDLLAGRYGYINNGNNSFSALSMGIPYFSEGFTALIDYDVDGDLDVFLSGTIDSTDLPEAVIYKNTNMNFSKVDLGFEAVTDSYGTTFDFDQDGDLDIAYVGTQGGTIKIYENKAINLISATRQPGLKQVKHSTKGLFEFKVISIEEPSAPICKITPEISLLKSSHFVEVKEYPTITDSAAFAANKININAKKVPYFWLKLCKNCPGYRTSCSVPKRVKTSTAKGIQKMSQLAEALGRALKVK